MNHNFIQKKKNPIFSNLKRILLVLVFLSIVFLLGFWLFGSDDSENSEKSGSSDKYELGLKSFSEGDFEKSAEVFENVNEDNNPEIFMKLAVSYYNQRKYDESAKNYRKVIELTPENYSAYNGLANVYRDQKEYDEAESYYRKAMEKNSMYTLAYTNLAIMLYDKGDKEKAKEVINEGLQKDSNSMELKNAEIFFRN